MAIAPNSTNIMVGVRNCQLQIWQFNPQSNLFERIFNETVENMLWLSTVQFTSEEYIVYASGYMNIVLYNITAKAISKVIGNDSIAMIFIPSFKH